MTKQELQKEIKDKVKPGVKPSDLKKLKRSKSAGDIPKAPLSPSSVPLTRSQSNQPFTDPKYPYTTLISQQEELDKLKKETQAKSDTISLLRKKIESLEQNPPSQLLSDQLKEKQKEVEDLRKNLEETNTKLAETTTELDNSLIARFESNKQFEKVFDKLQKVKLELIQTEDDAAEDIIGQDKEISNLRGQRSQLKLKVNELERDLNLANRAVEWRKSPISFKGDAANENSWQPLIISLFLIVWFISLLNNSWKKHFKEIN